MLKQFNAFLFALVAFLVAPAALAAPATQLKITTAGTAAVGTPYTFQVQALDDAQFVDTGFTGTVDFGSSDDFAILPAAYIFGPGDVGLKVFTVIFRSVGTHTISASTITGTFIRGTSSAITVTGGAAANFTISAPATANQNVPFNVTVAAKDSFGNAAAAYTGTVHFTSSDPLAVLPANTTLTSGTGTFPATLKTLGNQTITATDTVSATLTATSSAIAVASAPAQLTPSPTSLDFSGQSMKTTAPAKTITLTNSGGVATTVTSITTSTYFAVTHNCTTLNPAATCTAVVNFTPTAEGALNGTLTIVSGAGTQTVPLAGVGEKSLVTHYYLSILRRAPDAAGKSFWNAEAARVAALGANVNETWYAMSSAFFFSTEYIAFKRTDAEFVTDLYATFFNRPPDAAGFADWVSKLSQGMPREVVGTSFMFSAEFTAFTQSIFGTATVRPEIDMDIDFYRGLLGRLPDDAGFNSWLTRLRNAQCAGSTAVSSTVEDISSQFALSTEYVARNRTNSQYVGDLYNAFLRRGGELAGVQFWIAEIDSGRQSREAVRKQFVASPEFQARVSAVIAAGCTNPSTTTDLDINGNPIPNTPTGGDGALVCLSSQRPGPGPGPCGAYEIPVGTCSTGMTGENAITKAYMWVLEDLKPGSLRLGNTLAYALPRSAAMVWKFKTGKAGDYPSLPYPLQISIAELTSRGPTVPPFISLSTTKCDFDYTKTIGNFQAGCFQSGNAGPTILSSVYPAPQSPSTTFPYCPLSPDTTYYLNVRFENVINAPGVNDCPASSPQCAMTININ